MIDEADGFDEAKDKMFDAYKNLISYINELDDEKLTNLLEKQMDAFAEFFLFVAASNKTNELIEKLGKK